MATEGVNLLSSSVLQNHLFLSQWHPCFTLMTTLPELKSRKTSSPLTKLHLIYDELPEISKGMCTPPTKLRYEEELRDVVEIERLERQVKRQEERLRIRVDWASGGRQQSAVVEKLREYDKAATDVEKEHELLEKKQREMIQKRSVLENEKVARTAVLERMNDSDAQKRERLRKEGRVRDELRRKQEHERGLSSLDAVEIERRKNIARISEAKKRQKRLQEERELEELEIKLRCILNKSQQRFSSHSGPPPSDTSSLCNIQLLIRLLNVDQPSVNLTKLLDCKELNHLKTCLDSADHPGSHIQLKHLRDCISTSRLIENVTETVPVNYPRNPFLSALTSCANPVLHPITRLLWQSVPRHEVWPFILSEQLWPSPRKDAPLPSVSLNLNKWPFTQAVKPSPPTIPAVLHFTNNKNTSLLSNSFPCELTIRGKVWKSAGHFFHAMKYCGTKWEEEIRASLCAEDSSLTCNRVIRSDWEIVKCSVMREALVSKYHQNPQFASYLTATQSKQLICISKDVYWGVNSSGRGLNRLGLLLMNIRNTSAATDS